MADSFLLRLYLTEGVEEIRLEDDEGQYYYHNRNDAGWIDPGSGYNIYKDIKINYGYWFYPSYINNNYHFIEWRYRYAVYNSGTNSFSQYDDLQTAEAEEIYLEPDNSSGWNAIIVTCVAEKTSADRPEEFEWTNAKKQSKGFNLTAKEWRAFTKSINQFRQYRGISSDYKFTYVYRNDAFTADIYNEAVEAIKDIRGYGGYLNYVEPLDPITAYHLNILVSELNAIP